MKRARSTRHARVLRSSPKKREKLAPILQANYKETGRDTDILEMNRDWVLSPSCLQHHFTTFGDEVGS